MWSDDNSATGLTGIKRQYILITPCKNEGANLPNLVQSIVVQTIRPVLWVIVDDGSTDNTPEIIKRVVKEHEWIKCIQSDSSKRDLGLHLASIMRGGFDFAIEYSEKNGLDYEFLGNVDGDLSLDYTFFENLIIEFEKDPKLGVASGGTNHIIGDKIIHAKLREDEPSGGHMLIRKGCFEACGGIPLSYSMDSVLKAKARLRGWKTRRFEENIATEIRDVGSAEGYWKGFVHLGNAMYYLNFHPLHVIAKSISLFFRRQGCIKGIACLVGYLNSAIRREKQVNDEEVRDYFWNKWKNVYKQPLLRWGH
ncbi:Glycosyltransferase involved in cell wall bisynthesis [Methanophagales archaeon]|nr:Glycosyltransferase involved in cell wall bisynthesis [Methanophagales archaeon]